MAGTSTGSRRESEAFQGPILVDAHVHFYDRYDRAVFFDGALANFRAAAALGVDADPAGCLMFTESAGHHYVRRWVEEAGGRTAGPWRFHRTGEDYSLIARRDGEGTILLVAGRQIATEESLEVLALGADLEVPDGMSLRATLDAVSESDAIPVLPWGFGKWWFGRGRLMSDVVRSLDPARVFLGDNSGRPRALPDPNLFRLARERNILILPGTDPLPFASESGKAGSYGFVAEGPLDRQCPAQGIKRIVQGQTIQPKIYGPLESLGRFCRNQVLMQLRKRG